MSKNILLIHFKTGERDGVSLEMEKRARIFTALGANVTYLAGVDGLQRPGTCIIEEFNAEASYNRFLREQCFRQPHFDENTIIAFYYQLETSIYKKLLQAFHEILPDMVFVHNVFSHGCNLPATTALLRILDKCEIPTVAVHHDFWYERESLQQPQYSFIREILDVLPPKRDYIVRHQVINTLACEAIRQRRNIQAEIIGDYFDFQQPIPLRDAYNQNLRAEFDIREDDLVILHATRITGHKVIENALLFAHELEKALHNQAPVNLGGRLFTKDSRVVVLFPNFVEPEAVAYYEQLLAYQQQLGVKAVWASERFLPERRELNGTKIYSFWDSYVAADIVTYTSIQEGFGNQFLEAVYFKKIPVILEYPVFEKDLKHEGYEYVSLGASSQLNHQDGLRLASLPVVYQAVRATISILQDETRTRQITDTNFRIAQSHHDVSVLARDLQKILTLL